MSDLKVGDKAPDFSVVNDVNETVNLKDLAGQKLFYISIRKTILLVAPLKHNNSMKRTKKCKMPVMLFWVSVATR